MIESFNVTICEEVYSSDKRCEDTISRSRLTDGFIANDQWCKVQSLGYNAVQTVESPPMFRRNIFPSSKVTNLLPASCWVLALFILRPGRRRRCVLPKRRLAFNRLHWVISPEDMILYDQRHEQLKSYMRNNVFNETEICISFVDVVFWVKPRCSLCNLWYFKSISSWKYRILQIVHFVLNTCRNLVFEIKGKAQFEGTKHIFFHVSLPASVLGSFLAFYAGVAYRQHYTLRTDRTFEIVRNETTYSYSVTPW
jgi:hypothetical protein